MKVNLAELRQLEQQKLITLRPHPTLPLLIANYTQHCAFENKWTDLTRMCRGLIINLEGEVIARPFPKFFNLGQHEETMLANLPTDVPTITVKHDGSLGILYFDGEKPCIATRGSFESDQAIWATAWIQDQGYTKDFFSPHYTYLFEIIYPENRIVVDYKGYRGLYLLAVMRTNDPGIEKDHRLEAKGLGMRCAEIPPDLTLARIQTMTATMPPDEEGFVLRYANGLRVKIKGDEYLRLHRIITQCSARRIWECLMAGTGLDDWLERVPDEMFKWVTTKRKELEAQYFDLFLKACQACAEVRELPTRKEQALALAKDYPEVMHLVFGLLDGKSIREAVWKRLRPEFETPFKGGEVDEG